MFDSITEADAAEPYFVGEPVVALLAFVGDLARAAATGADDASRRALVAPYTGIALDDARALIAGSGDHDVLATIERDTVALAHESTIAARRFVRALGEVRRTYRAQGATAAEHVTTVRVAFDLDACLTDRETATLATIVGIAARLDAARPAEMPWEATELVHVLSAVARAAHRSAQAGGVATAVLESVHRPLERREPEPARDVRRKRGHFSASSLGAYAECERRWFFRYVCAAVEDRGSSASFYGTAFHWALERFHEEIPRFDGATPAGLEQKLGAYLDAAFERHRLGFDTAVEYELQRRRARRTVRPYVRWLVERARRAPFTVIGVEEKVELALGDYAFVGYIDRLDRDDATHGVTVVDYKTGSIAESSAEYREKVARFHDFQLPFYYWARTAAGDRVTRLSLVPLKDASLDVEPVELEVVPVAPPAGYGDAKVGTIGIDELERARGTMIEIAATLQDGVIERFPATEDPDACRYCAYEAACRERPPARERRFGR